MTDDRAVLAAVSDERDKWHHLLLLAERAAFKRGASVGYHLGREQAFIDMAADWRAVAKPASRSGDSHAVYEGRRWGPTGRLRFGDPRPSDRSGQEILAAARASWEPLGPVPVCNSFRPGVYPEAKTASIVVPMPQKGAA